jgi:hypothetical protein
MVGIKKKPLGSWFLWVQKESYMGPEKPGQTAVDVEIDHSG